MPKQNDLKPCMMVIILNPANGFLANTEAEIGMRQCSSKTKGSTRIARYIVCTRHLCSAVVIYIQSVTPTACVPVLERMPPLHFFFSCDKFFSLQVFPQILWVTEGKTVLQLQRIRSQIEWSRFKQTCVTQIKSDLIHWNSRICTQQVRRATALSHIVQFPI